MDKLAKNERESEIEKYFQWVVEVNGGKTYKFKSINRRGVSDQITCLPNGTTWFVELKRPKGSVVAPLQDVFAAEVKALRQRYVRLYTKEQINEWIAKVMNP